MTKKSVAGCLIVVALIVVAVFAAIVYFGRIDSDGGGYGAASFVIIGELHSTNACPGIEHMGKPNVRQIDK